MSEKKSIVVLAHYYYPDVASTGQIIQDIAEGIQDSFDVTVICTVPSYTGIIEKKYKTNKLYWENLNGVKVIRIRVPEFAKSNKKSRILNLIAYYLGTKRVLRTLRKQDYILTISQPPIMGGMLGVYGKKKLHAKLIYCIQDFNPEQIEATKYIGAKPLIELARMIDNKSCERSDLVITVGRDLIDTLKKRFEGKTLPRYTMINNWIDEKEIYPLPIDHPGVKAFKNKYYLENKYVFMYSGNIGLYYDLEGLIRVIEKFKYAKTRDGKEVVFAFVGNGSVLDKLVEYVNDHGMDNVIFIPYQEKKKLIYSLNAADVHWCVNAKGIKGVSCPSKAYGIWGVKKPILAVLEHDSEIERIIKETNSGLVCEPGVYDQVEQNVKWFIDHAGEKQVDEMAARGYENLVTTLTKSKSINKYKDEILRC